MFDDRVKDWKTFILFVRLVSILRPIRKDFKSLKFITQTHSVDESIKTDGRFDLQNL